MPMMAALLEVLSDALGLAQGCCTPACERLLDSRDLRLL